MPLKKLYTLSIEEADRILQDQSIYRYDREWNIAICAYYHFAIAGNTLAAYARRHKISYRDYESIVQALLMKNIRKTLADLSRLSDGIAPIEGV
jgi:hypothetical protein